MLTKKSLMPLVMFIALLIGGCRNTNDHVRIIADSTGYITAIHLSSENTKRAGVIQGSIVKQVIDKWVPCSGYLVIIPESTIGIPSPAAGRITSVLYPAGHYVKAGSIIASLENIDFITLQQEYHDAKNQFDYLHEEYTRQGELTIENATSVKKMQIARREYQSAELRLHALRSQLEILGICPDSLKFNNMSPVIHITAPGSGNISNISIHLGSYVEKGEPLFELINKPHLLAKLNVPEQYVRFLQKGQFVDFWLAHDTLATYKAQLLSIVREIDTESHSATVYAELSETKEYFISGMSINAKINADKDTANLINSRSILHNSKGDYLFVMKKGRYTKFPITKGNTIGEMTEIFGFPNENSDSVVINGVEYLNSLFEHQ
jgi:cobalt-zinc-cadmium efflux system membrane fusion protein